MLEPCQFDLKPLANAATCNALSGFTFSARACTRSARLCYRQKPLMLKGTVSGRHVQVTRLARSLLSKLEQALSVERHRPAHAIGTAFHQQKCFPFCAARSPIDTSQRLFVRCVMIAYTKHNVCIAWTFNILGANLSLTWSSQRHGIDPALHDFSISLLH